MNMYLCLPSKEDNACIILYNMGLALYTHIYAFKQNISKHI